MLSEKSMTLKLIQQANAICGESPIWDWRQNLLLWVDLDRPAAYACDPHLGEQVENRSLQSKIGIVNGRVKLSRRAVQNVANLRAACLPLRRAPASGRPHFSQSFRLPGCFGQCGPNPVNLVDG